MFDTPKDIIGSVNRENLTQIENIFFKTCKFDDGQSNGIWTLWGSGCKNTMWLRIHKGSNYEFRTSDFVKVVQ